MHAAALDDLGIFRKPRIIYGKTRSIIERFITGGLIFDRWAPCVEPPLVEEAGLDELLEKELDVADLRVFDAEVRQHAHVAVLHAREDRAQVLDVVAHQPQRAREIADRLRFCVLKNKYVNIQRLDVQHSTT